MSGPRFRLETSPSGKKVLTVWYHVNGWDGAIVNGLAAVGLAESQEKARWTGYDLAAAYPNYLFVRHRMIGRV